MTQAKKRAILIGGVVAMVAIVVAGWIVLRSGSGPTATGANAPASDPATAAQQYLTAFASGDTGRAGSLTDHPAAASALLRDAWSTLRPTQVAATLGKVGPAGGDTASAAYTMTWAFAAGQTWSYPGTFQVVRNGGTWRVHWAPAVLQPTLQPGQRIALVTTAPDQPAVIDRDGKPLVLTGAGGPHLADPRSFPDLRSASSDRPRRPCRGCSPSSGWTAQAPTFRPCSARSRPR